MELTFFRCRIDDATSVVAAYEDYLAERADTTQRADSAERMAGDCERCQEPHDDGLVMLGGEAICDACVAAETTPCSYQAHKDASEEPTT